MDEPAQSYGITPRCFGCGACASLAPEVFATGSGRCRIVRQPLAAESVRCRAALLVCPASAIKLAGEAGSSPVAGSPRHEGDYASLLRASECVRWTIDDIAWNELQPALAPEALRGLVREMAFAEHATYSATQRFLQAFYDDVDFSSWLSVWFYEETRHPHVLSAWLRALGEPFDDELVRRGRVSTPFMKSKVGTLVTNIISELTAAHAYHAMANLSPEPVLAAIARRIAGDEARHAASFSVFAQALIARAPERAVLDALKVLHIWLDDTDQVTHPIQQMIQRLHASGEGARVLHTLDLDFAAVRRRATRLIGALLELPLSEPADVLKTLQARVAQRHGQG